MLTLPFILGTVLLCTGLMYVFSYLAPVLGLMDQPNNRKRHRQSTPLIGGIVIYLCLLTLAILFPELFSVNTKLWVLSAVIACLGVLDDRFDIPAKYRLSIFFCVSLGTILWADIRLEYLGDLFGAGDIYLGYYLDIGLTLFALLAGVNAFNMIDGIDGLFAGVLLVLLLAMLLLVPSLTGFLLVLIILICSFLLLNLQLLPHSKLLPKVFLGDAGSTTLGFLMLALLIEASQQKQIQPVNVLWLIALPLMDFAAIVVRRLMQGKPIMRADRNHLHHIFIRLRTRPRKALIIIVTFALVCASIGVYGQSQAIADYWMLVGFLAMFGIYLTFILNAWRVIRWLRNVRNYRPPKRNI